MWAGHELVQGQQWLPECTSRALTHKGGGGNKLLYTTSQMTGLTPGCGLYSDKPKKQYTPAGNFKSSSVLEFIRDMWRPLEVVIVPMCASVFSILGAREAAFTF